MQLTKDALGSFQGLVESVVPPMLALATGMLPAVIVDETAILLFVLDPAMQGTIVDDVELGRPNSRQRLGLVVFEGCLDELRSMSEGMFGSHLDLCGRHHHGIAQGQVSNVGAQVCIQETLDDFLSANGKDANFFWSEAS